MTIAVLANDRDDDGDARALVEASAPAHGTARLTDAGAVEYTPAPDYHGSDRFTYVVGDGSGLTAPADCGWRAACSASKAWAGCWRCTRPTTTGSTAPP